MIKKLFGIFEKQMVEEKFLQWIFRTINNLIISILTLVFRLISSVINIVFKVIIKILSYPDKALAVLARHHLAKKTPVENKVMFLTFQGDYTCNPKYIAEELLRQNSDYQLVWDVKTAYPTSDYPMGLKFVRHNTYEFYKELASAKVIIENTNIVERLYAYKKKEQFLLHTVIQKLSYRDRWVSSVLMGMLLWDSVGNSLQSVVRRRSITYCRTVILKQKYFVRHIGRMYLPFLSDMQEMISFL